MKDVSLPFVQLDPELTEYCQVAFVSRSVMLTVRLLVIPSEFEEPVSLESAMDGADGAVVSPVTAKLLVAALVLPARSVSLTLNWWVVPLTTVAV